MNQLYTPCAFWLVLPWGLPVRAWVVQATAYSVRSSADDAEDLRVLLLQAVKTSEAQLGRHDAYGQRYTVDFLLAWRDKQAMVRSGWIIEHDADTPRLTTCYPL